MGLLSIMALIAKKKLDRSMANAPPIIKTPTPLGLHQGSVVELPDVDIALAQSDGSIIKAPTGTQVVTAVGTYSLFGLSVYNVYLNDGQSYIQVVTKVGPTGIIQDARLWTNYQEVLMQSKEDWEFWLGSYQKYANGEFIRDANGVALVTEYGLIGWPSFQVDGPPAVVYNRSWSQSNEGIEPIAYTEIITDSDGEFTRIEHEAMEYYRQLTDSPDSVTESLLASMVQQQGTGSVDIFVGIPIDHNTLKVLSS